MQPISQSGPPTGKFRTLKDNSMHDLSPLFKPLKIGQMRTENRLMMSGMSAGMMLDKQGNITDEMIAYYEERARNNPGMVAVGASAVVPSTYSDPLPLFKDEIVPSLRRFTAALHKFDCKVGIQLWNGGGTEVDKRPLISPSGLSSNAREAGLSGSGRVVNKALSLDEIHEVVGHFAAAARRCESAGFDFIEIHGAHGYLISNFLTPLFNRRTDEYGGAFENRIRFMLEVVRAVKAAISPAMALGVKFNGNDFLDEHGWTLDDACRLAPILEAEGADYLSVTAGVVGAPRLTIPPMYEPQGCYTHLAEAVKKTVGIPVCTVGRVKDPLMALDLIESGKVDIVAMGRPMIADPDFVGKTRKGELEDIRKCLADCRGCIDEHMRSAARGAVATSCVVNPRMTRESVCIDIEGSAKDAPKTILVVGAGLSGLEAARRTAFSGHKVILCETRDHIGGQIILAARMPGREEIADMVPWYARQLKKYGVDIRLSTTVDPALIDEIAPDVVILATGSVPIVPQNMMESVANAQDLNLLMADDILDPDAVIGQNILVIGGNQIGMVEADWLSEGGRQVHVVESSGHFAPKLAGHDRWYLLNRLARKNVKRSKNVHNVEIDGDDSVWLVSDTGRQHLPGVDTIVFASERGSIRTLEKAAEARGIDTHVIGDAFDVVSEDSGTIFANIAQAYDLARTI